MNSLELKIPPPILVLLFATAMWFARKYIPLGFDLSHGVRMGLLILLSVLSLGVALAGVVLFRQQKTTVSPVNPESTSSLVTAGIYQYTRNPMYLGLVILLTGWGFWLANVVSLALIPWFILYMTRFQVIPEEKALEALFGDVYFNYKQSVRRWL